MEPAPLLSAIAAVFPLRPLPTMSLRQAVLADQNLSRRITDREWADERRKDGHLVWSELSDDVLLECRDGLAHLDREAFAYYLGAFLGFAVRHVAVRVYDPKDQLVGTVVFSVTNRSDYNLGRLKRLTDAQADCVVRFLQFVAEHSQTHGPSASKALTRYWLTERAKQARDGGARQ